MNVIIPVMGNRLKELRIGKRWTLEDAAAAFGLSRSGYIKIERGERKLTTDRIERAKEIYGVTGAEVLGDDAPSTDEDREHLLRLYDQLPDAAKQMAVRQIEDLADLLGAPPTEPRKQGGG